MLGEGVSSGFSGWIDSGHHQTGPGVALGTWQRFLTYLGRINAESPPPACRAEQGGEERHASPRLGTPARNHECSKCAVFALTMMTSSPCGIILELGVPAKAGHACPIGMLIFSFKCPGDGVSQDL